MFHIKKWITIFIFIFLGGITISQSSCFAHEVSICFGENDYTIEIDKETYFDDYSLMSDNTYKILKQFIGTEKHINLNRIQFSDFKKLFSTLEQQLSEISSHSDYNSDDYIPFTSEIENSLNEKYINLFKFILLVSSMQ